MFNFLLDHFVD